MDEPINFKDILRTIEAGFWKNLRTTEARFDFTGPYKKKSVQIEIEIKIKIKRE